MSAGRVEADPIALDTSYPSTVTASVELPDTDPSSSSPVTSLPYADPTTESDGGESSTVTASLTTSGFSFTYTQVTGDANSSTSGGGNVYFTAGAEATYTITGTETSDDTPNNGMSVSLYDLTSSQYTYNEVQSGSSPLLLDSTGGPLSGPLISGHVYEFVADESAQYLIPSVVSSPAVTPDAPAPAPDLSGMVDITFAQTIPEPASVGLLVAGVGAIAMRRRHSL